MPFRSSFGSRLQSRRFSSSSTVATSVVCPATPAGSPTGIRASRSLSATFGPERPSRTSRTCYQRFSSRPSRQAVGRQDAVGLVKHIYLCFLGPSVSDDVDELKRRLVLRHRENGFITAAVLRQYGMSALHLNRHGVPELVRAVAREFADELGLETKPATQWNAEAFRRDNEDTDWTLCRYCGRKPVDLHHLLLRSEYPELTYDPDNVVPLSANMTETPATFGIAVGRWR